MSSVTTGYVGTPVARREDRRLLMGDGRYAADIKLPGMLEAVRMCRLLSRSSSGPGAPPTILSASCAASRTFPPIRGRAPGSSSTSYGSSSRNGWKAASNRSKPSKKKERYANKPSISPFLEIEENADVYTH